MDRQQYLSVGVAADRLSLHSPNDWRMLLDFCRDADFPALADPRKSTSGGTNWLIPLHIVNEIAEARTRHLEDVFKRIVEARHVQQ